MRKRFKNKKSCAICKPHKTGHAHRWKNKEYQSLRGFEREKLELEKRTRDFIERYRADLEALAKK